MKNTISFSEQWKENQTTVYKRMVLLWDVLHIFEFMREPQGSWEQHQGTSLMWRRQRCGNIKEKSCYSKRSLRKTTFLLLLKTHATIFVMCTCIHAIAASALAAYRARGGSTMRRDKSHTDDNKRTVKCPCEVSKINVIWFLLKNLIFPITRVRWSNWTVEGFSVKFLILGVKASQSWGKNRPAIKGYEL